MQSYWCPLCFAQLRLLQIFWRKTELQLSGKNPTQPQAVVTAGLVHFIGQDAGRQKLTSDHFLSQLTIELGSTLFKPIATDGVTRHYAPASI